MSKGGVLLRGATDSFVRVLRPPAIWFSKLLYGTKQKKPVFFSFPVRDQIFFAKRLGMVLRSGMPIMEGLHMLAADARSRSTRYLYRALLTDVASGQPLSGALAKFPGVFDDFSVNVVRVGEASGTLHENLEYLAEEQKNKQALRRRVIGSLLYPSLIVVATAGITVMLTVYIFPKIVPIFQSIKASLPLSTRILMSVSQFLSEWGLWCLSVTVALVVLGVVLHRYVPRFHCAVDFILLRLPLFGALIRDYNLANSLRTLGLLLKSDVGVIRSMELVAASTRNLVYRRTFTDATRQIVLGKTVAEQFRTAPYLFPPLVPQMISVGESTGNLSSSLQFLSNLYEEEMNETTKNLTTLLEPVLMIIMGIIVGFIAISIITPIYSITQNLSTK